MRVCSRLKSTYVDIYSEELHLLLLKNAKDARDLRKKIRSIDKRLTLLGYQENRRQKILSKMEK